MLAPESISRQSLSTPTDQFHHRETIWRVLADVVSLIILLVVIGISNFVVKPFTRGFFCSDASIRYPYKNDTIPTSALMILSIVLPLLGMWITELFKRLYFSWYPKQPFITHLELFGTKILRISPFVRNLYMLTVVFLFGYFATLFLTLTTKNFVGNLRPHFLDVCQPSYKCSAVTSLDQFNAYLQEGSDYTCQNNDTAALREARRSFFSGHASLIFYGCTWLIMYIHVAWSWRHLGILGHLFQGALAILASYIGYSRITDYQHHWYDVAVGTIIGSLIAFVVFKFILNWRHYHPRFLPYTITTESTRSSMYQGRYNAYLPVSPEDNEPTIESRL